MSFFKLQGDQLIEAPNFVKGPGFELLNIQKDTYNLPIDGWHWFATREQAVIGLGYITPAVEEESSTRNIPDRITVESITKTQLKLALLEEGLLSAVENEVAEVGMEAVIIFEDQEVYDVRDSFMDLIATATGKSPTEMEIFMLLASTK